MTSSSNLTAAVIINDYGHVRGGQDGAAIAAAISLASTGINTIFFCAVAPVREDLKAAANLRVICLNQWDTVSDPNRLRAIVKGLWNLAAARTIRDVLDELLPSETIVNIHSWTKALSCSVIDAVQHSGFRMAITVNDYFLGCPNGAFFNFPERRICSLRGLSGSCITTNCDSRNYLHKCWRVLRQLVQRRAFAKAGGFVDYIIVSDFTRRVLESYLPMGARIHILGNPVETEREPPVDVESNSAFVFIGRLCPPKGVQIFAEASRQAGVKAVFVGDGESKEEILALNPAALVTGWLSKEGVRSHLRAARALVFSSIWYEADPMTLMEASALGIPAIVSDACAGRDSVVDGETGYWFKSGDIADLVAKIVLLGNDRTVRRLGEGAYSRFWRSSATLDVHTKASKMIFDEILLRRN